VHGHQKGWYSLSSTGPQGNVEKLGYSHIWSFFSNQKLHDQENVKQNWLVSTIQLIDECITSQINEDQDYIK
jgi:hypothetical protein